MSFPKFLDWIMTFSGDDDCAISWIGPDEKPGSLSKILNNLKVWLATELIVEHAFGEFESISLFFPEKNLKHSQDWFIMSNG